MSNPETPTKDICVCCRQDYTPKPNTMTVGLVWGGGAHDGSWRICQRCLDAGRRARQEANRSQR